MHVVPDLDKAQFRTDPALLRAIRAQGLNPNEVARQAFEAEARRLISSDWLARLRDLQKGMKPWKPGDMARAVRAGRDER